MTESERPVMSDAEREVMKVLWDYGPLTVRETLVRLKKQGSAWARSTVTTLIQRLESKGYVTSDKSRFAHSFRAAVSLEDVMRSRMNELASELCDGSALPLVLAFSEKHTFTAEELLRFREMIDKLEPKVSKRGPK